MYTHHAVLQTTKVARNVGYPDTSAAGVGERVRERENRCCKQEKRKGDRGEGEGKR